MTSPTCDAPSPAGASAPGQPPIIVDVAADPMLGHVLYIEVEGDDEETR
ncbi:hypothetical protein [Micromonospora chersina]